MKNVIPFTKEIIFKSNIAEISSISLEHDYTVESDKISGNFIVSGDYKAHELSINKEEFKYNLPFDIEIDEDINKDSINLEILDFSYDFHNDILKVNIEFSVTGERIKEVEKVEVINDVEEDLFTDARSYFEEIEKKLQEQEEVDEIREEVDEIREEVVDEVKEDIINDMVEEDISNDTKEMILSSTSKDDEYVTYHVHVVKENETIESICKLYEISSNLISEYNDVSSINIGDKLIIPSYIDE